MAKSTEGGGLQRWVSRNIAPLATVATLIALLFAGFFWVDAQYAKAADVRQLERRFDLKVTNDLLEQTQTRIWQLQDRVQQKPDDATAKEDLRKLIEEKQRLEEKRKALEKGPE